MRYDKDGRRRWSLKMMNKRVRTRVNMRLDQLYQINSDNKKEDDGGYEDDDDDDDNDDYNNDGDDGDDDDVI